MNMMWVWILVLFYLQVADFTVGLHRPSVVNVGAIFSFDSSIGRVAKLAMEEAVKDVNSDSSVLPGTELVVHMQNANCSGFVGLLEALKFMETEVVAVIGPQSSVIAHMISHIANELQRPLLSFAATDPTLSSLQFPFFVRTTQSDYHQMAAISDIVDFYSWREVVVIFIDDDYGRNGISALDDSLAARRCRISYKLGIPPVYGLNRSTVMDVLVQIQLSESRIIVVHVHPNMGLLIFSVAQYLQMMNQGYVWIATDWLSSILDTHLHVLSSETLESIEGVIVLRHYTPDSDKKMAFLSRWNNLTGGSLGLNSYGLYAYDTVWLVARAVHKFLDGGGVVSFAKDPNLQFTSGNLGLHTMRIFNGGSMLMKHILESSFIGLSGRVEFGIDRSLVRPAFDVINVIGNGFRRVGYWSNSSGLSIVPPEMVYTNLDHKLSSMIWPGKTTEKPRGWVFPNNGKLLRIGVPRRVSYQEFVSQVHGTDNFKGFCIEVFQASVNLLAYAVPYEFVPFGDGNENPSYLELVNSVATGLFDAAVGDIAIVKNRTKLVDFTQPYTSSGLVVTTSFRKLNSGAWAFLLPFSKSMWAVSALFFVLIGVVIWILEHRLNDEFRGTPKQQFITILWFSFSTLFFAHRESMINTLSRVVLIIWLFVVLIVNSSYTASLTSFLTVQQLSSPVKSIDDLKRNNDPIGYQSGSFAQHYLTDELGISESRLVKLDKPQDYARALQLGPKKEGGVIAIVDERPYIDLFLSTYCNFGKVGHEFTKSGWGFAFPKDSTLAVDISTAIMTLSENGDLQRIRDKWLTSSVCSSDGSELESDELHLSSFVGLFVICAGVCITALAVYILQVFSNYRRFMQREDSLEDGSSVGQRSNRVRTFLTLLMDEKKSDSDGRRVEASSSSS